MGGVESEFKPIVQKNKSFLRLKNVFENESCLMTKYLTFSYTYSHNYSDEFLTSENCVTPVV